MNKKLFTYKKSGVNIDAADSLINFISAVSSKKKAKKSFLILEVLVLYQIFQIISNNLKLLHALTVLVLKLKLLMF